MPVTHICPTCGKQFTRPPSHRAIYCSLKCVPRKGPRAERVKTICQYCGKAFETTQNKIDHGLSRYCCKRCREQAHKPKPIPVGTQFHERVTVHCQSCGKEMRMTVAEAKHHKFCSRACVNRLRPSPKKTERVACTCQNCGRVFYRLQCVIDQGRGRFCSRQCLARYYMPEYLRARSGTSIERALAAEMNRRGLPFQPQYVLAGWVLDFAFPEYQVGIEADGDYWHNRPDVKKRDRQKNAGLKRRGWKLLRFWETDINASASGCVDKIEAAIASRPPQLHLSM